MNSTRVLYHKGVCMWYLGCWTAHKPQEVFTQRSMDIFPFSLFSSAPPPRQKKSVKGTTLKTEALALTSLCLWTWSEHACGFWGSQDVTTLDNNDFSPLIWSRLCHFWPNIPRCSTALCFLSLLSFTHQPFPDGYATSYSSHWTHPWPLLSLNFIVI